MESFTNWKSHKAYRSWDKANTNRFYDATNRWNQWSLLFVASYPKLLYLWKTLYVCCMICLLWSFLHAYRNIQNFKLKLNWNLMFNTFEMLFKNQTREILFYALHVSLVLHKWKAPHCSDDRLLVKYVGIFHGCVRIKNILMARINWQNLQLLPAFVH